MKVVIPVIAPRVSESAAARQRAVVGEALRDAHADPRAEGAAMPTSSAPASPDVRGGEDGASVDTVPSMRPISPGCTTLSSRSLSLAPRQLLSTESTMPNL